MRDLERLALAAFVDPLTGLRNRRGLNQDLAQRLALAGRGDRPLTVVVGDLDGLKAINDRDGHAAGDLALRSLASAFDSALRAGDTAYRVGGDEFLLLLSDTGAVEAETVIARVKATAPAFSWGSATFPADGGDGPSLMELADQRLLSGRRQVPRLGGDRRGIRRPSHSGAGAIVVAALTVTALLGGVGVGFAAQTVMDPRESPPTSSADSSLVATPVAESAGEQDDAAVESVAPAGEVDAAAASISSDQVGTAAMVQPGPMDDLGGLIGLPSPDLTSVVEVIDETVTEATESSQTENEPQKGSGPRKGEGESGGQKKAR